jgi:hypothetical protein
MIQKCLTRKSINPSAFVGLLEYFFLRHATYRSAFSQYACSLHEATQHNGSLIGIRFVSGKVNESAR